MNPFFNGQEMTCILCGAKDVSVPNKQSNWRCIEADGWPFFACPNEFPQDNSSAEAFKEAYKKALAKALAILEERKCRICGCSEHHACQGGCTWVEWDLCSRCSSHAAPIMLQIDLGTALPVLGAIQLACRHPGFTGPSRKIAESFARSLQSALSRSPAMASIAEAGWHPELDACRTPKIVIPKGRGN